MPTDPYVFVTSPALGTELDLARLRGYALADAHVRYRRARDEDVLFTLGVDALAEAPADDAQDWGETQLAALKARLGALELSFDWSRSLLTSDPEVYRWSQWLFVKLVEAGLAYRRGDGWHLRTAGFHEENDRRVGELEGWSEAVRAAQRELLHRVDGYDFEATALDGTTLSVFTGHPDAVADAEFVGLSAQRPELDGWLEDADVRRKVEDLRSKDWSGTAIEQMPVVEVGMSVQVPGVAQPLPILVSPAIDARFGPSAILGVPSADAIDKALAKRLPKAGGLAWKVESKPPKTTPAVRYLVDDMPLSQGRPSGAPVPAVDCAACGTVPVPVDQLPVRPGQPESRDCPSCGGPAQRDAGTIHPRLATAWVEIGLAVPPDERANSMFDHAGLARRLPTAQTVEDHASNVSLLDTRTVAKALRDIGVLSFLDDGEPHGPTLMHGPLRLDGVSVDAALEAYGSDALRFALLHAAAPGKAFDGGEAILRQAAGFLAELRAFAEPRLGVADPGAAIDSGDGLRRRLAAWCDTAVTRMSQNYEQLDLHRATRNAVELLARIQDFERRVTEHRGEVGGLDRDAAAAAAGVLVDVTSPIAPSLSALRSSRNGSTGGASWPSPQREPAAA